MKRMVLFLSLFIISHFVNSQLNLLSSTLASSLGGGMSNTAGGLSKVLSGQAPQNANTGNANNSALASQIAMLLNQKNLSNNGNNANGLQGQQGIPNQARPNNMASNNMNSSQPLNNYEAQLLTQLSPQTLSQFSPQTLSQLNQNIVQNSYPQQNANQFPQISSNMDPLIIYLYQLNYRDQMNYLQKLALTNPLQSYYYMQYFTQINKIETEDDPAEKSPYFFNPLPQKEIENTISNKTKKLKEEEEENKIEEKTKQQKEAKDKKNYSNNPGFDCDRCNNLIDEVCGDDGKTYNNVCLAKCVGIYYHRGKC